LERLNSKLNIRNPKSRRHLPPDDIQRTAGFEPFYLLCVIGMVYRERLS